MWMEMLRSLCGDAQDVRNMGISIPEMLCHGRATFKWKSSTYGQYEYILVAVDYMPKWVKALPSVVADSKNSKKIF
jgi:hypothetical protein